RCRPLSSNAIVDHESPPLGRGRRFFDGPRQLLCRAAVVSQRLVSGASALLRREPFQPLGYTTQLPQAMHVQALNEPYDRFSVQFDRLVVALPSRRRCIYTARAACRISPAEAGHACACCSSLYLPPLGGRLWHVNSLSSCFSRPKSCHAVPQDVY